MSERYGIGPVPVSGAMAEDAPMLRGYLGNLLGRMAGAAGYSLTGEVEIREQTPGMLDGTTRGYVERGYRFFTAYADVERRGVVSVPYRVVEGFTNEQGERFATRLELDEPT